MTRFGILFAWIAMTTSILCSAEITFQDGFESSGSTVAGPPSGWTGGGFATQSVLKNAQAIQQGNGAYSFIRENSLDGTSSGRLLTAGNIRKDSHPAIYRYTAWVYIGGQTPAGSGQVSSDLALLITDSKDRPACRIGFTTRRYNRDRAIQYMADKIEKVIVQGFPVDTWMQVMTTLNEKERTWGFEIQVDGSVLLRRADLPYADPAFFRLEHAGVVCQTNNRNDGMYNLIDNVRIETLAEEEMRQLQDEEEAPAFKMVGGGTLPRQYKSVDDSFYNSAFLWVGDNLNDRISLTDPDLADKRARQLSEMGINGVVYSGRHFRLSYMPELELIKKYAKIVTDACHRYGIKVIEHHDMTIMTYSSYPIFLEKPDWFQEDIRTGEKWRWVCPNNDDFIRFYSRYLVDFQKATNVDGYMLDEISLAGEYTCGCKYCRESYRQATGIEAPSWGASVTKCNTPEARNWLRWRSQIHNIALKKLLAAVRTVKPTAVSMSYCSDYSDSTTAARGSDLSMEAAMFCSFEGWENMIGEVLNGWRQYLRGMKLRLSYGNYYDIPVYSLNRETTTKEAVYFAWAISQLGKHSIWYGGVAINTDEEIEYFKRHSTWKHVMPHKYARCLTDTGLLLSHQTRKANPDRDFMWHDMAGWCDMLLEGSRQFDTLLDGDLELPDRLRKYRVLLLPSQAALSENQCKYVAEWVRNGGTLIFSANASLYDEYGEQLDDFRLAKPAGISFQGITRSPITVKGKADGLADQINAADGFYLVKLTGKQQTVLAEGIDPSGRKWPAIVESRFGQGRFVYVAPILGKANVELELRNGTTYQCQNDPAIRQTILALVDRAHQSSPPAVLDLPKGVTGVCYQLQGGPEKGTVYVHLLNVGGKSIKPGDKSYFGRPEKIPLPPVTAPIKIHLATQATGPAVLQTPERKEFITLQATTDTDGTTTLEVPGSALGAYLQIKMPAQPIAGQEPLPAPLADEIREDK